MVQKMKNGPVKKNSLKEKHIKLGVELGNTKQLTKNAQMAVKTISKATAKAAKNTPVIKGSNLVEQMVDPEKALKSIHLMEMSIRLFILFLMEKT